MGCLMELLTYDQTKLDPKRCMGFALTFGFLEDFIILILRSQTKVHLGALDKL